MKRRVFFGTTLAGLPVTPVYTGATLEYWKKKA